MNRKIRCAHCGCMVDANPRVKDQRFCGQRDCQRARKALWQREKMAHDPDYRANQRRCQRIWRRRNVDYWRKYRSTHRQYRQRNRVLQRHRDNKRRRLGELAKMDTSQAVSFVNPGIYYLIPEPGPCLAKMDALAQKFHVIPAR